MKKRTDESLRAITALLQELMVEGTLEQGQAESLARSIKELRRARRSSDATALWNAVDHVARVFLRSRRR